MTCEIIQSGVQNPFRPLFATHSDPFSWRSDTHVNKPLRLVLLTH